MPKTISIHKPITDDGNITLEDALTEEVSSITKLESDLFSKATLRLIRNEKHCNIVKRVVLEREKEAHIAKELNVSRQYISGIKLQCLNKLREKVRI